MTHSLDSIAKTLQAARVFMSVRLPFFASLYANLQVFITEDVPTAAVSCDDRLFINPDFLMGVPNVQQRGFLLAHEVMHPTLGYFQRARGLDPQTANQAHDYVINAILHGEFPGWVIKGALLDAKYNGWTFEEVYADLSKTQRERETPKGSRSGSGSAQKGATASGAAGKGRSNKGADTEADSEAGASKETRDGVSTIGKRSLGQAPGGDILSVEAADKLKGVCPVTGKPNVAHGDSAERSPDRQRRVWEQRLLRAAIAARSQGRGSAGIDRLVAEAQASTVPWHEHLRLAVNEAFIRSRIDWGYPSRRSDALGFYNPREESLGFECAVYVDSSGSISQDNLAVAITETAAIIHNAGGQARWMEGDDGVLDDKWIGEPPLTIKGGGGTSFVPVFEHLRDNPPKMLVIFTDTFGTFPDFAPDYPVIWAVFQAPGDNVQTRNVPFGEIIAVPDSIGLGL